MKLALAHLVTFLAMCLFMVFMVMSACGFLILSMYYVSTDLLTGIAPWAIFICSQSDSFTTFTRNFRPPSESEVVQVVSAVWKCMKRINRIIFVASNA